MGCDDSRMPTVSAICLRISLFTHTRGRRTGGNLFRRVRQQFSNVCLGQHGIISVNISVGIVAEERQIEISQVDKVLLSKGQLYSSVVLTHVRKGCTLANQMDCPSCASTLQCRSCESVVRNKVRTGSAKSQPGSSRQSER
eukprot:SAG31_NODE_52_length_30366_cov_34.368586_3_plen_141_part_00